MPRTYSLNKRKYTGDNDEARKRRRVRLEEFLEDSDAMSEAAADSRFWDKLKDVAMRSSPLSSDQVEVIDAIGAGFPAQTPPSSPPPLLEPVEADEADKVADLTTDDTDSRVTLAAVSGNRQRPQVKRPSKPPRPKLVQSQLNLGNTTQKVCKTCGMAYVPCDAEDAALHRSWHNQNLGGIDLGKPFRKWAEGRTRWGCSNGDTIVIIDRRDRKDLKNKAMSVLSVACAELGAVKIPEKELWACRNFDETLDLSRAEQLKGELEDPWMRYRVYLYLRNGKCVGVCLAERIFEAHTVIPHSEEVLSGVSVGPTVTISDITVPARIGISRIWVSSANRGRMVASTLLGQVEISFYEGTRPPVLRSEMAFSQPTESGAMLARSYFGRQYGWHVYKD